MENTINNKISSNINHKTNNITPTDLSFVVWFLLGAAVIEILFYRLATHLAIYANIGTSGILARFADLGEFSMYITGVLSLVLICVMLPQFLNSIQVSGVWWRAFLILISPIYLLIIVWAVFRPNISSWLLIASLFATLLSIFLIVIISILRKIPNRFKRIFAGFALMIGLAAFAWTTLDFLEIDRFSNWGIWALRSYLASEAIMLASPIFGFFIFVVDDFSQLKRLVKKPHWMALGAALLAVAIGITVVIYTMEPNNTFGWISSSNYLSRVSYRTVGITVSISGGPILGIVTLFFAALLTGSLILPSTNWPSNAVSKQLGFGIAMIYLAGLQPFSVYQYTLLLSGFLFIAVGLTNKFPMEQKPQYENFKTILEELDTKKQ